MTPREFRAAGHRLVEDIAEFLDSLEKRPVTPGDSPAAIRKRLPGFPRRGKPAAKILREAADLLFNHSLLNGHPRFWGYITSSAAPAGALADLLAAAVNPNAGAWILSPMASEMEAQAVRWIAEMIGYPASAGGLLVSGGNMANFVGFLVGRQAAAAADEPNREARGRQRVYGSRETHTWIQKAADLFGLGSEAIRLAPVDAELRVLPLELEKLIEADARAGDRPFMIVGTAGTVSTGAVDPLPALAEIARRRGLWFHVDGAYGGVAACLPDAPSDLAGIADADSVAVDPHKWLYAPLEAGCVLVRDRQALKRTFSFHPPYYRFGTPDVVAAKAGVQDDSEGFVNYFEWGLQNSRGFRALKVWIGLRQAGLEGYRRMIGDDIRLAREMFRTLDAHPEIEARTQALSIVTFRYVPPELRGRGAEVRDYLNRLNAQLLDRLQQGGEAFVSNAVLNEDFVLRACIVNFRTQLSDVRALPEIVARIGRRLDSELMPLETQV